MHVYYISTKKFQKILTKCSIIENRCRDVFILPRFSNFSNKLPVQKIGLTIRSAQIKSPLAHSESPLDFGFDLKPPSRCFTCAPRHVFLLLPLPRNWVAPGYGPEKGKTVAVENVAFLERIATVNDVVTCRILETVRV